MPSVPCPLLPAPGICHPEVFRKEFPPALPPIRVLLVAPSLNFVGGQAVQADRLLRQMAATPAVQMRFHPIDPPLPSALRWLLKINYLRTLVNFAAYFPVLLWRTLSADILHIFTASYTSYLFWSMPAILVGRLLGKKVILNYRDGQCEDHLTRSAIARRTIPLAHRIVAPSGFLVDVFRKFHIPALSIFNFIDTSAFLHRSRQPLRPIFMSNRSFEPLYNIPCILRAFARIQQRYPDASLTLAHDGPLRPQLEALARQLHLRHVRFIGHVPQSQIPSLYHEADIYLTTPNIDCMPGSLLECFASGLPLVATKAGGIPYIVTHDRNGLLVDLDDDLALAEACFRLLSDPQLAQRLTSQARLDVELYSPIRVRDQWISLYRELLSA